MSKERRIYRYEGPVTSFNRIIKEFYKAGTQAVSLGQAKAQIMYQFKTRYKLEKTAKIELPGKLYLLEE